MLLVRLLLSAVRVVLDLFLWLQQHVYHPIAEWWVETVLGTWEESTKSVIREAFAQVTRFLNGWSAWVVSLFDTGYYQGLRRSWKQQHAWQTWWHEERQSTFNAVIERVGGQYAGAAVPGDAGSTGQQATSPSRQASGDAQHVVQPSTDTKAQRTWRLPFVSSNANRRLPSPMQAPVKSALRRSPSDLFDRPAGHGISEGLRRTSLMEDLRLHVEAAVTRTFATARSLVRAVFFLPRTHAPPSSGPNRRSQRGSTGRSSKQRTASSSPRPAPAAPKAGRPQRGLKQPATPLRRTLSLGRWEHLAGHTPGPMAEVSSAADFIRTAGYPLEVYNVVTDDGYILQMERIPRAGAADTVFFMHGVLDTSLGWVSAGVTGSQAFAAWDQGFDVWLGNTRCNPPRRHQEHQGAAYWLYTNNELALYDVAALLDHIHTTKCAELGAGSVHLDLRHLGPLAPSYLGPHPTSPPATDLAAGAGLHPAHSTRMRLSNSDTSLNRLVAKPLDTLSRPTLCRHQPNPSHPSEAPMATTSHLATTSDPTPSSDPTSPSTHPPPLHPHATPFSAAAEDPPAAANTTAFHLTAESTSFPRTSSHHPTPEPHSAPSPFPNKPPTSPFANPAEPTIPLPPIRTSSDPLSLPCSSPGTPIPANEPQRPLGSPPHTSPTHLLPRIPTPLPSTPHQLQVLGHGAPDSLNRIPYSKLSPTQVTSPPLAWPFASPDAGSTPTIHPPASPHCPVGVGSPTTNQRSSSGGLATPLATAGISDLAGSVAAAAGRVAATTAAVAAAGVLGTAAAAGAMGEAVGGGMRRSSSLQGLVSSSSLLRMQSAGSATSMPQLGRTPSVAGGLPAVEGVSAADLPAVVLAGGGWASSESEQDERQAPAGAAPEPYRLRAVAHSLGGASLLMHVVMCCKQRRPHHITRLILLTPAGFHVNIPKVLYVLVYGIPMLVRLLRPFWPGFAAGLYLPTPVARLLTFKASLDLLRIPAMGELARRALRMLTGGDASQWDRALQMPHYNARAMPALSLHQGLHLIQWTRTHRFQLFDYGTPELNRRHYGSDTPPDLAADYHHIDIPVDIMAGVKDGIVPPENVRNHYRRMKEAGVRVTYKEFNYGHLDFTFAAKEELRRYVTSRLLRTK